MVGNRGICCPGGGVSHVAAWVLSVYDVVMAAVSVVLYWWVMPRLLRSGPLFPVLFGGRAFRGPKTGAIKKYACETMKVYETLVANFT